MKVALIQSNPVTGALSSNMDALIAYVRKARELGADLCIAPEMAICGNNAGDLLLRSGFAEKCRNVLDAAAATLGSDPFLPPLLLGAPVINPVPEGKNLQNCAVLLHEGKVMVVGRKVLLPAEGIYDDARYFEPGVACGVLHFKGWRLAVTVGEDIWNDRAFWQGRRKFALDPVEDFMNAGGADGLINLTALPFEQGLSSLYQRMLSHMAARYRVPVVSVNMVGGNDSLVFHGQSLGFDNNGRLVARAPAFEEALLVFDVPGTEEDGPVAPALSKMEEIWQAVVLGTRDYARKCGFRSVVLGLSGGIDSALVAAIAAEALGPQNVTGLLMPSLFSSEGSIDDSLELAANLGIATHVLPVTPMYESFRQVFDESFPDGFSGVAQENAQSRIRGTLLMTYANRYGALLLATGNKSESSVGYATLYGDMAGGLAPIGDLFKMQVYALCRWYNSTHGNAIPAVIIDKVPSAELRPEQKDSDSLPPYEKLDPILQEIVENRESIAQIIQKGYDACMVEEVSRLVQRAEFKRQQAAPALHLSKCSFGTGWRSPIAIGYPDPW